jgi:hypothetical protein
MEEKIETKRNDSLLLILFRYLRRPRLEVRNTDDWMNRLFNVLRLWSLSFFLSLIFAFVSNFLLSRVNYEQEDFALNRAFEQTSMFAIFIAVVFIAPITEEIAFRLGLKFSPVRWGVGITMLFIFLVMLLEIPIFPSYLMDFTSWQGFFFTSIFFVGSSVTIASLIKLREASIYRFFKNYFSYFFYSLAILFAFLHITNYQQDWMNLLHLSPLLVMPQLLLSFSISFIRMHYGFFWAVFAHGLNNFVVICVVLLFLPLLAASDTSGVNQEVILENLSVLDVSSIFLGFLFFMGILFTIMLSISSLLLEIYHTRENNVN